jgi:hypothetical protein
MAIATLMSVSIHISVGCHFRNQSTEAAQTKKAATSISANDGLGGIVRSQH